jgi:hypothetical protein
VIGLLVMAAAAARPSCPAFEELATQVWEFRVRTMPFSADDIPRVERPPGLVRSWSQASVQAQRAEAAALGKCLTAATVGEASWPIPRRVDVRLIRSVLARVDWELDLNRRWQRDPGFYLEQAMTPLLELLTEPPPIDAKRAREFVSRLRNIPQLVADAESNLDGGVPLFAQLALNSIADIRAKLSRVEAGVLPLLPKETNQGDVRDAVQSAVESLESYRNWLTQHAPSMRGSPSVGRTAYVFFLQRVALIPYSPEQLLAMAQQEWDRSVTAETLERQRNSGLPPLAYIPSLELQIARYRADEAAIRRFLDQRGILSLPKEVRHYTVRPIPDYLDALGDFGEQDWFTGPSTLQQDGVRWLYPPSPKLGYFGRANARDPRPNITHEGIPGHYLQLNLSWRHPDPIRRHYYDSGPNEGIGFYAEEMMMQAGLYDDSPRSRELIWEMSRLRAARVTVDVKLALGDLPLDQAAAYLAQRGPMDSRSAHDEAAGFSVSPGQAMTYQVGKLQIEALLAESRLLQGEAFSLRHFHDTLWLNGNVPLALQRWEMLGLDDEVRALDTGPVRPRHRRLPTDRPSPYRTSTSPAENAPWMEGMPPDTAKTVPPGPE